jgi:alcohol dehydrogenase class IV
MYEFHWPTRTLIGRGLIEHVGEYAVPSRATGGMLLVAPREEWARSLVRRIARLLRDAGWERVEIFDEVEPNPSWGTVMRGVERGKTAGARAVLAVGGGSTMDAGKVIAERGGAAFLCTVPTTAGTGGEISPWAVISNLDTRDKDSVVAKWPDVALLDPELTLSLPPEATYFTGVDALAHGVEAYLSSNATPITDALAWEAVNLVAHNLHTVVTEGGDLSARQAMLEGSLLAGAAMLWAGLGLAHAIANPMGGLFHDLAHGHVLASCMESVVRFNAPAAPTRVERLRPVLERALAGMDVLAESLTIGPVVIPEGELSVLAQKSIANVNVRSNPRPVTEDDVIAVARESFRVVCEDAPEQATETR